MKKKELKAHTERLEQKLAGTEKERDDLLKKHDPEEWEYRRRQLKICQEVYLDFLRRCSPGLGKADLGPKKDGWYQETPELSVGWYHGRTIDLRSEPYSVPARYLKESLTPGHFFEAFAPPAGAVFTIDLRGETRSKVAWAARDRSKAYVFQDIEVLIADVSAHSSLVR